MRGPIPGVHPLVVPVLYSFRQAQEDLAKHLDGLTREQIWATPYGFGSVGFHVRHIAGSTGRLMTYLEQGSLSEGQLEALTAEDSPDGPGREELIALVDRAFREAELAIRSIDTAKLSEPRAVGRQKLPTTVIGLLVHIAEHTQRHVGQAISAAKWARVRPQAP